MKYRIQSTFDKLVAPPAGTPDDHSVAPLPDEVQTWLEDLMLLKGVPLSYIIPDPHLLPPESVRFFHIDPSWTARLIEGALAAANTGGGSVALSKPMLAYLRKVVEVRLAERIFPKENVSSNTTLPTLPMLSGMLLRSEIVRRWPGLNVTGYENSKALSLARKERLAAGLMVVIFAGVPDKVEIAEPFEGVRFGIEPKDSGDSIQLRKSDGSYVMNGSVPKTATVTKRAGGKNVINIESLATSIQSIVGTPVGAAHLSLCLQQQPFIQVFGGADPIEKLRVNEAQKRIAALKAAGGGT